MGRFITAQDIRFGLMMGAMETRAREAEEKAIEREKRAAERAAIREYEREQKRKEKEERESKKVDSEELEKEELVKLLIYILDESPNRPFTVDELAKDAMATRPKIVMAMARLLNRDKEKKYKKIKIKTMDINGKPVTRTAFMAKPHIPLIDKARQKKYDEDWDYE